MRADPRLAAEAAVLLVLIRTAFRLLPFAATDRWLARATAARVAMRPDPTRPATAERVGAAVRAAARRLPGTTCLAEALAAEAMLRRRGIPSTRHIGVRAPARGRRLDAHAWLESDGTVIVGNTSDLDGYRVLSRTS